MKKILFILLALMPVMLFTACSDDDNNIPKKEEPAPKKENPAPKAGLVGSWKASEDGQVIIETFDAKEKASRQVTAPDGLVSELEGTYKVENDKITINWTKIRTKKANENKWSEWVEHNEPLIVRYTLKENTLIHHIPTPDGGSRDVVFQRQK